MRALVGLLVVLLASCAMPAPRADEPAKASEIVADAVATERAKVSEIVADAVAAARAPVPEQQQALRVAQEAYKWDQNVANQLRLATLFAVLPDPLRNDSAAYALLKPLAEVQGQLPFENFGALLAGQVAERLRLARESERAMRERELSARDAKQREEELRQRFERSQRAAEQREAKLQEQLEALKSIERGIVEREEKLRH